VRIGAQRYPAATSFCQFQQIDIQVLTIGIAINLDGLIKFSRKIENVLPISFQTETKIVNSSARVAQYVNVRISQSCEVALSLIFFLAQRRMKAAEYQVKACDGFTIHISAAPRIEIEFN